MRVCIIVGIIILLLIIIIPSGMLHLWSPVAAYALHHVGKSCLPVHSDRYTEVSELQGPFGRFSDGWIWKEKLHDVTFVFWVASRRLHRAAASRRGAASRDEGYLFRARWNSFTMNLGYFSFSQLVSGNLHLPSARETKTS